MDMNDYENSAICWPELLSSDQFFSDRCLVGSDSEELTLQWAVFMDGLRQYWMLAEDEERHSSEEFIQEEEWVAVDDYEWPFSFAHLCETFGFQPASVREALRAWKNIHAARAAAGGAKKKPWRGIPQM
ncbi:MAG: hypothetical protein AB7G75_32520 [Candidatus Binatia bacterium]